MLVHVTAMLDRVIEKIKILSSWPHKRRHRAQGMQEAPLPKLDQHQVDMVATSLVGQEIQGLLYSWKARVMGDKLYLISKVAQTATRLQEVKMFRERLTSHQVNDQASFHGTPKGRLGAFGKKATISYLIPSRLN